MDKKINDRVQRQRFKKRNKDSETNVERKTATAKNREAVCLIQKQEIDFEKVCGKATELQLKGNVENLTLAEKEKIKNGPKE